MVSCTRRIVPALGNTIPGSTRKLDILLIAVADSARQSIQCEFSAENDRAGLLFHCTHISSAEVDDEEDGRTRSDDVVYLPTLGVLSDRLHLQSKRWENNRIRDFSSAW